MAPRGTLIRDIRIKDKDAALARILGQFDHYKKRAPQFRYVVNLVREAVSTANSDRLVDLNVASLASTCSYLDITFDWSLCSEMELVLKDIEHPGQWAPRISTQLGACEYINPPGDKHIFDPVEWAEAGIALQFTDLPTFCYDCAPYEFVEHLSILDVLMLNEPESVMAVLRKEPRFRVDRN
jgi:hypothetical protein